MAGDSDITGVAVLGSTGSIGINTLDVLSRHPERYRAVALTAHTDVERMTDQCLRHQPRYAVMADEGAAERLAATLHEAGSQTRVLGGASEVEAAARLSEAQYVVAGIVGAAGLKPALAAAKAGKRILLANKEALVITGRLFMDEVRNSNAQLMPVDSEHNAVFQCMNAEPGTPLTSLGVRRILLTASGGPFRDTPVSELAGVTAEQACDHPNWEMGRKISVDSATMMNKGLEVIEACWLFDTSPEFIEVVVHPQSVVHSMVEYADGSVLAQMANPDMRTPIGHALAWPDRIESGAKPLDMFRVPALQFERPDLERFPCLRLAMEAMQKGGTGPAILNGANEVAVAAFLDDKIGFTEISLIVERTLQEMPVREATSFDVVMEADEQARESATGMVDECARRIAP